MTPALESGIDMQIVTTETEPGRKCAALSGPEVQFPEMVLPTSGIFGVTTIANGAIRGMKTLRDAAVGRPLHRLRQCRGQAGEDLAASWGGKTTVWLFRNWIPVEGQTVEVRSGSIILILPLPQDLWVRS